MSIMSWRHVSRADKYRLVAWLNTLHPYKMLLYSASLIFGVLSLINDVWFKASWDIANIPTIEYGALSACFIFAPLCSFISEHLHAHQAALMLSAAADVSLAWAIFAYSWIIVGEFGLVWDCPLMWALSLGMLVYACSDLLLLRLIATQPAIERDDTDAIIVAQRLQRYVGMRKWRALTEAADAIDILYEIDPDVFKRRDRRDSNK